MLFTDCLFIEVEACIMFMFGHLCVNNVGAFMPNAAANEAARA